MFQTLAKLTTILLVGGWVAAGFPTDCWDGTNTCGDTPECGVGQPPVGATHGYCDHQWCDNGVNCSWNTNYFSLQEADWDLYTWTVNHVQTQCVEGQNIFPTGNCCQCSKPGVVYEQGPY